MCKKTVVMVLISLVVAANCFGAEITRKRLIGVNGYGDCFNKGIPARNPEKNVRIAGDYYSIVTEDSSLDKVSRFAQLEGNPNKIDTELEWILTSYYFEPVLNIRPAAADAILPKSNPKLADQKLGAAVFQEIQVLRFLGDTAAVSRHESIMQFITGRGNATRAEIEAYYRNGIRGLISDVVDEEFNKISFGLYNYGITALIRDSKNQYVLTCESAANPQNKITLTNASLDALLSEMRDGKNKADFTSADLNTVRAQAALIPAVVYADWKAKGVVNGVDGMALIKETLTNFYIDPNRNNYNNLLGIYARFRVLIGAGEVFADKALSAYSSSTYEMSTVLGRKIVDDMQKVNLLETAKVPNDPRFNIFSTPYSK